MYRDKAAVLVRRLIIFVIGSLFYFNSTTYGQGILLSDFYNLQTRELGAADSLLLINSVTAECDTCVVDFFKIKTLQLAFKSRIATSNIIQLNDTGYMRLVNSNIQSNVFSNIYINGRSQDSVVIGRNTFVTLSTDSLITLTDSMLYFGTGDLTNFRGELAYIGMYSSRHYKADNRKFYNQGLGCFNCDSTNQIFLWRR